MKEKIENLPTFFVAGLTVRTINKDGQAMKDIAQLWHRLMGENIAGKLDDREGNEVYCLYTDYESDYNDYYNVILGHKVSSIEYLPEGITGKAIPAAKYEVFSEAEGSFPQNIGEVWQHIWQSALNRKYTTDFDVYTLSDTGFEGTTFKTYVAIN